MNIEAFSKMTRAEALAAGAVQLPALAAARQCSLWVVRKAVRVGELAAFRPIDSRRALILPDSAATWRAAAGVVIPESFSVREVADQLHMSADVVWRAIRTGRLKAFRPGGSSDLRVTAAAVQAWLWSKPVLDPCGLARRVARTGQPALHV